MSEGAGIAPHWAVDRGRITETDVTVHFLLLKRAEYKQMARFGTLSETP
jgi:hypothetical protein